MTANVNMILLQGNIGSINELKTFDNGGKQLSFTMATNRSFKRKNSDTWEKETTWHNIVVSSPQLAESLAQRLEVGQAVFITGELRKRKYKNKSGNEVEAVEVMASTVRNNSAPKENKQSKPSPKSNPPANKQSAWEEDLVDDSIPF